MKNLWGISIVISLAFIISTGIIAFGTYWGGFREICFYFHLIPFGIGFSGGSDGWIIVYYILTTLVITLFFRFIIEIIRIMKNH